MALGNERGFHSEKQLKIPLDVETYLRESSINKLETDMETIFCSKNKESSLESRG